MFFEGLRSLRAALVEAVDPERAWALGACVAYERRSRLGLRAISMESSTVHCTRIPLLKYSRQVDDGTGSLRRWEHVSLQPLVCCVSVGMSPTNVPSEQQLTVEWSPCTSTHMPHAAPVRLVRAAIDHRSRSM